VSHQGGNATDVRCRHGRSRRPRIARARTAGAGRVGAQDVRAGTGEVDRHAGGEGAGGGHAPDIIKALGGPDVTIGDLEYDNLFVLVPATQTLSRIRY